MAEGDYPGQQPDMGPPHTPPQPPERPAGYDPPVGAAGGGSVPGPPLGPPPGPPQTPNDDRVLAAWHRRTETDYIFDYWTALGWTVLTIGIFSLYVLYQLVRRMRDHNARRVELFDAALAFAWEEAGRRGLQQELTPSFQRASAHMDVLRRMTSDFRDPVVWVVLSIIVKGIVDLIAFVLLDRDLVRHDRSEIGVEYELSLIYGRFGQPVPAPDQTRLKAEDNYVGRIVASIFTLGIYVFWWYYDQMTVPNRHFQTNWAQEDALVAAVGALR
jgi:hypothetical protein